MSLVSSLYVGSEDWDFLLSFDELKKLDEMGVNFERGDRVLVCGWWSVGVDELVWWTPCLGDLDTNDGSLWDGDDDL